jgi:hypothetical protein
MSHAAQKGFAAVRDDEDDADVDDDEYLVKVERRDTFTLPRVIVAVVAALVLLGGAALLHREEAPAAMPPPPPPPLAKLHSSFASITGPRAVARRNRSDSARRIRSEKERLVELEQQRLNDIKTQEIRAAQEDPNSMFDMSNAR